MKRIDVITILEKNGAVLVRHGGSHDWYYNPTTNAGQAVPRHREIDERLSKSIIKKLS
jgi:predicted RNA binding protein YcfA (HicA-like mRNA interferase family)